MVVYDANSRQLSVQNDTNQSVERTECPYCHRPFREEETRDSADEHGHHGFNPERPFQHPDYFGMLAASQRGSPASTGPATPNSHLRQAALRSGRSRDVSGAQGPPTGAEFIGSEPATSARQGISKSAFSPGYFNQFFKELRVLGKGGNGVVLLVEHVMDHVSLGQFACKRIPVGDDHDWLEKVLLEVKLLQKIPHKNLVAYHWVWLEDYQPSKFAPKIPCLWMLQEFCNGGDLHNYVLGPNQDEPNDKEKLKRNMRRRSRADVEPPQGLRGPSKLMFEEIFSFFRDITSGLHHLHSKGYIHRDLKPSNCLLQCDGTKARVLISDFGEVQAAGAVRGSTGATGTISYCAPEVLRKDATDGVFGDFTTKSDIFSLGMIVYFMCFGRLPYSSADDINEENEDLDELRAEITRWPGFDDEIRARPDLPERLYKYLKRLLSVDPSERPSTDEILASIKAGAGLGDTASALVEENSARVSSVDSPKHRPSPPGRKQSTVVSRPGLSSLASQSSVDTLRARSPSERRSGSGSLSHSHSRPTSPTSPVDGSMIKLPPKHRASGEQSPIPQSPQLMLPPPPGPDEAPKAKTATFAQSTSVLATVRATLFLAKVLSVMLPCSPLAANAWLLYPLLGLAALDLGLPVVSFYNSLVFTSIHTAVILVAIQHDRLCERQTLSWEGL